MTAMCERLRAWMKENGHTTKALADATGIKYSLMSQMVADKRRISESFKWKFGKAFGYNLAIALFAPEGEKNEPHPLCERIAEPEKYAAHKAIAKARRNGTLLAASECECHVCHRPAQQWHHPSYDPDDHLCVVPLCRSCHRKIHKGVIAPIFGIVATPIGILRIAIAGLP